MTALLNLSGGIDSALCMWLAYEQNRPIVTHHIRLNSSQGRADVEDQATDRIRAWFANRGYTPEHLRSGFDWGDLPRLLDVNVWSFFIGAILAKRPDIDTVIVPGHLDAFVPGSAAQREATKVKAGMCDLLLGRQPIWDYPLADMRKADIVRAIPTDLLAQCWWCRTPRNGMSCHRCHTCRQVDAAL